VTEKAPQQGIAKVFDEYRCHAIRRVTVQSDGITSSKAAVTMDLPPWGLVDLSHESGCSPNQGGISCDGFVQGTSEIGGTGSVC